MRRVLSPGEDVIRHDLFVRYAGHAQRESNHHAGTVLAAVAVHYHRTRRRLGDRCHRSGEEFRVPVEHVDANAHDGGLLMRRIGQVLHRDTKPDMRPQPRRWRPPARPCP